MYNYAIIENDTCVATGQLRKLPERPDLIERINGVPDIGWTLRNGEWTAPEPEQASEPARMTPLDFMELFTHDEQQRIVAAAADIAAVGLFWEKLKLADTVSLDDPRVIGGVQALEFAGLIAAGRADEILNNANTGGVPHADQP